MGTYTLTTWLSDRSGAETLLERLEGICKFRVDMLGTHREQYDWQRGECTYLEDGVWDIELGVHEKSKRPPSTAPIVTGA
jgi:lipopolysaccharide transport system ATP-binding protein